MKVALLITVVAVAFFVWGVGRAVDHQIQQIDQHLEQIQTANQP